MSAPEAMIASCRYVLRDSPGGSADPGQELARSAGPSYAQFVLTFWGLADYQMLQIIEVFADREDAEEMLRDCLSDEPNWAQILDVVPLELEFSLN